jgi:hypothetical protein
MHNPARKKGRALSDLNRTAAYRFTVARPGQAAGFGPAWLRSAASARIFFFRYYFIVFANPCKFKNP